MKIAARNDVVETNGLGEVQAFTVEMNAFLFASTIANLYADKVKAPMRELCTNAYDAHVAAGRADQPFEVTLPSRFNSEFKVRDFGISMTHEQVMGHYSSLFSSSKRDTNDAVGMLGLGSKSPFAYTTLFNITCWKDGEERTYGAFLNDGGIPQITLVNRAPSEAPQGVEVSYPVKASDVDTFRAAAAEVFFAFDPYPIVHNDQFKRLEPRVIVQGTNWKVYDNVPFRGAMAKQGCVLYPIDKSKVSSTRLLDLSIVMEFPIGSLQVSTSRESLSYEPATVQALLDHTNLVNSELAANYEAELAKCANYLEACQKYQTLSYHSSNALCRLITGGLKYKGSDLQTRFEFADTRYYPAGADSETKWYDPLYSLRLNATEISSSDTVVILQKEKVHYSNLRVQNYQYKNPTTNVLWVRNPFQPSVQALKGSLPFINIEDLDWNSKPKAVRPTGSPKPIRLKYKSTSSDSGWDTFVPTNEVYSIETAISDEQAYALVAIDPSLKVYIIPEERKDKILTNFPNMQHYMTLVEAYKKTNAKWLSERVDDQSPDYYHTRCLAKLREFLNARAVRVPGDILQFAKDGFIDLDPDKILRRRSPERKFVEVFMPDHYAKITSVKHYQKYEELMEKYPLLQHVLSNAAGSRQFNHYMELLFTRNT